MNLEIKKSHSNHPDFLLLKEKLEDFLDAQYSRYNVPREKYRQYDGDIELTSVFIAYSDNSPIGICGFKIKNEEEAELKKVFVLEENTNNGIATSLISLAEDDAKNQGVKRMILKTGDPLRGAIDLYLRLGYNLTTNYPPYKNDPTAVCMEKSLEHPKAWSDEKRNAVREATSYLNVFRNSVFVIKYDGTAMLAEEGKNSTIQDMKMLASCGIKVILIHGGRPYINEEIEKQGVMSDFFEGERITTPKVMEIIQKVYLEKINPQLVVAFGGLGIGISGINGSFITCERKKINGQTLGMTGKVKKVNRMLLDSLLKDGFIPIVSPIGMDENG